MDLKVHARLKWLCKNCPFLSVFLLQKLLFILLRATFFFFSSHGLGVSLESGEAFDAVQPIDSCIQTVTGFMPLILLHRPLLNIPIYMSVHPLEVTLKLSASVPKLSNLCQIQY